MPDDPVLGRTMKAASTVSVRDGHAIVKAGEFIEARFGAGTSPSLAARKTLALLIAKAAGEAWRPGSHVIAKRELRGTHNANDRIKDTLDELMELMTQGRFRHVPVIEDGALVGIVSIGDIVKHHIAEVEMEVSAMRGDFVTG